MARQFTITKDRQRIWQPILVTLWGPSFTGKTYSALRLARGLVGPKGRIGVIDTENRRSLMYKGVVGGQWEHLDFQPPFSPQDYTDAFKAFEHEGGFGCLIVDSASHVWSGEGGVLDQVDKSTARGLAKWKGPKTDYKRMVDTLLRAPFHVIFCMRAKMGIKQVEERGKTQIIETGLVPIIGDELIYEMGVSILLGPDQKPMFQAPSPNHFCNPQIPPIKAPPQVMPAIRPGEHLSEATGEAIRAWLEGGVRDVADQARRVAARGTEAFRGWWKGLPAKDKADLKNFTEELKAIAAQADAAPAEEEPPPPEEDPGVITTFDDPFVDEGAPVAEDGIQEMTF